MLVLYKRTEPVVWTKGDAAAWGAILDSETWKKIEAFNQDSIVNGFIAGKDKAFLSGWLFGITRLGAFKGENAPEREGKPEDMVPIQFWSE